MPRHFYASECGAVSGMTDEVKQITVGRGSFHLIDVEVSVAGSVIRYIGRGALGNGIAIAHVLLTYTKLGIQDIWSRYWIRLVLQGSNRFDCRYDNR